MEREIRFGIRDMTTRLFVEGIVMYEITQSAVDRDHARRGSGAGLEEGVYEKVERE